MRRYERPCRLRQREPVSTIVKWISILICTHLPRGAAVLPELQPLHETGAIHKSE